MKIVKINLKGGTTLPTIKVLEGIYWVGAVDWNIRFFHGPAYSTHRGTSYNSYLILDEKKALVDTVYQPFTDELLTNIETLVKPEEIDYIVVNHIEPDHSGALPEVIRRCSKAVIYCTQKAKDGLIKYYNLDCEFKVVKTGDKLNLGSRNITFIEAPMLHWPDSMLSYIAEDELLLSNDAFGQHLASTFLFNDEVDEHILMDEAAKYYANILYPFSPLVINKINDIVKLDLKIKTIAPAHGLIWRKDPSKIIEAYLKWAKGEAKDTAIIVYDTMWESTEMMAKAILEGLQSEGVECKLFKVSITDRNDIIKELLEAKAVIAASSTINNDLLPVMAPFLDDLIGLKPKNKLGAAFGSYGWAGGAVKTIEEKLQAAGIKLMTEGLQIKWRPTEEELQKCLLFGKSLAQQIKAH